MNVEGLQSLLTTAGFGLIAYAGTVAQWFIEQAVAKEHELETEEAKLTILINSMIKNAEETSERILEFAREHLRGVIEREPGSREKFRSLLKDVFDLQQVEEEIRARLSQIKEDQRLLSVQKTKRVKWCRTLFAIGGALLSANVVWMICEPSSVNP